VRCGRKDSIKSLTTNRRTTTISNEHTNLRKFVIKHKHWGVRLLPLNLFFEAARVYHATQNIVKDEINKTVPKYDKPFFYFLAT